MHCAATRLWDFPLVRLVTNLNTVWIVDIIGAVVVLLGMCEFVVVLLVALVIFRMFRLLRLLEDTALLMLLL